MKQKLTKYIQPSIIISACVLLVVIIALVVSMFLFTATEHGTWRLSTEDYDCYYTFDSDSDLCTVTIGTTTYYGGNYQKGTKNGDATMTLVTSEGILQGTYTYKIFDSKTSENDTLTLTDSQGKEYTLYGCELPRAIDLAKNNKDFVENKELTGTWQTSFGELEDMKQTVTFNSDGTMTLNQSDIIEYDCVYSVTDDTVTSTYYHEDAVTSSDFYLIENGVLKYKDLSWTKIQ